MCELIFTVNLVKNIRRFWRYMTFPTHLRKAKQTWLISIWVHALCMFVHFTTDIFSRLIYLES